MLDATCENGVVTCEGQEIDAEILSEGMGSSSGAVIVDKGTAKYFTSNASDIKDLITSLESIIQQVVLIATALDAVTVSPGSATALITQLTTLKTQLGLTKDQLK